MAQLTVRQLISQLRKMPPDATVIWKDHDHSAGEYNDFARFVEDVTEEFSTDPEVRFVAITG